MEQISTHTTSHNGFLMILAFLIASVSALMALELAKRVTGGVTTSHRTWILFGGTTLGLGIWSMHFVAMLGHSSLHESTYSIWLIIGSMIPAIAGCILSFGLISRKTTWMTLLQSSGLMGFGIVSMHYIGMTAIQSVQLDFDPLWVLISIGIAWGASFLALWVGFFSSYATARTSLPVKLMFSLLMGTAIFSMHLAGMRATTIIPDASAAKQVPIDPTLLAWLVTSIVFLLFGMYFIAYTLERQIQKRDLFQTTILESTTDAVVTTTSDGEIQYQNQAFAHLFEGSATEPFFQDYHPLLSAQQPFYQPVQIDTNHRTLEVTSYPLQDGSNNQVLWFIRDVTEAVASQRLIEHMAFHDALTDLPNRHKLDAILKECISQERSVACLYIDVNRWRFLSDILGHHGADELIMQVADRLKHTIHPDDVLTRIGPSEFVILLFAQRSSLAHQKAEKCIKAISSSFEVDGTTLELTMSAGISHFPKDSASSEELIQFSRLAADESRQDGENNIKLFEESSRPQLLRNIEIEKALVTALSKNELTLVYQPKIDLKRNRLEGVEALLRWQHPQIGKVEPSDFIPIAENTGLIHSIGHWVIREGCRTWVRWQRTGIRPFTLSLNVSPLQFAREDFVDTLQSILLETGMDPMYLELEVTESSMLSYEASTREKLTQLHQLGILISLDDFGTGYSSFSQLRELPVQVLKIDRSFIENLFTDRNQEAIVRSMIQLGHNLGMKVLMEGVETSAQLEWLLKESCDYVQGYYFSLPLSETDVPLHVKETTTYLEFGKH
ncbi:EAL domain-containing protein [Exiguobacterium sp. MER 193]|uniref:bifunctional diguanylate cyclase/phosphodiesterase n=1 Tax=Exiguobacterium sp. MER 193 TaxID=2939564 RepID=UPI00203BEB53|nr:EAL domain-containing protein [Exiguobacterium sp. MER 193]MCM3281364.1 EAL domain-containing protein [Exiguobacterium sp. MER 193]